MNNPPYTPEDFEELRKQQELAKAMRQQGAGSMPGMPPGGMSMMGGGQGGGGGMGAAGPWAALAAAVVGNETYQNSEGNRPADTGEHMKDLASGKVLEYDAAKYAKDIPGAEFLASMGNPEGVAKNLKKGLMPWEWF